MVEALAEHLDMLVDPVQQQLLHRWLGFVGFFVCHQSSVLVVRPGVVAATPGPLCSC
jgi:hypothetical protein